MGPEAGWELLRQDFVGGGEELRFGQHLASLDDLFAPLNLQGMPEQSQPSAAGHLAGAPPARPQGRVERDPLTGQIIRKRP